MNNKVSLYNKMDGPVEEAYRSLRTNIQFCSLNGSLKSICITSCNPNEGKTTITTNLAISLATNSKKVLLIDADMRKPRYFKDVDVNFNHGLSSYLSGMAEFEDIISETNIDNLYMILCGPKPPNAAELLGTQRFGKLLEEARKIYDMIIIDTPPLGSVIDAAIIASQADGTIFVIESNSIEYKKALKVKTQLEKANTKILGVVLNKIPKKNFKDYYTYYNYYNSSDQKKPLTKEVDG